MSDLKPIPLNKLSVSAHNVRRTERKSEIDALAASIAAHGLLQNLTVTPRGEDGFDVVAGARRLAALKSLAKSGALAKDHAIPCRVVESAAAAETSLTENVQRVAMNAMDEVEAFASLVDAGHAPDAIAARFGCTLRHVEQRLALGRLSPKIRAAYRRGELTLDAARAFCLNDDHAAQERVFRHFSKPITHAASVRSALTQGRVPAQDRLAVFVTLEAYEAAGGRLSRDLFEDAAVFLDDADLLQRLAAEKLAAIAETVRAEGWGWVETRLGHAGVDGCANERLRPGQRALTRAERKTLSSLDAQIEELDAKLEEAEHDNPLWEEREAAEEKRTALLEAAKIWDQALIAHAGALIAIDRVGAASITRGLIKRGDLKTIGKIRSQSARPVGEDADAMANMDPGDADAGDVAPRLSRRLIEQLTLRRTCALRAKLARAPEIALPLLVFTLMRQSAGQGPFAGLAITANPDALADDEVFQSARETLDLDVSLASCLDASPERLLSWLAVLVAEMLNLAHQGAGPGDLRLQHNGDVLATALDLEMRAAWAPDAEFWMAAPKALALAALETAPAIQKLGAEERTAMFAGFAKMKKADLASAAAEALRDAPWLPDLLITPPAAGIFVITEAGAEILAQSSAETGAA